MDVFPNLNLSDKKFILEYVDQLIDLLILHFNIPNKNKFLIQLKNNNNRDMIAIINLLLPYINENNYDKLESLDELYSKKDKENKYLFSNYQFNRGIVEYNKTFFIENYKLLKETLQIISNKLYVNWGTIIPVQDYKSLSLYKDTIKKKLNWREDNNFYFGDIYNILTHHFYLNIKDIKWLLYSINSQISLDILHNYINIKDVIKHEVVNNDFIERFNRLLDSDNYLLLAYMYVFLNANKYVEYIEFDRENEIKNTLGNVDIIEKIKKININDIYEFLRDNIIALYKSPYKDYLEQKSINPKYIYNFSKSLCHDENFNLYPSYFHSLDYKTRDIINDRIYSNQSQWFNIKGILKRLNIEEDNETIFKNIRENIIDIVFKAMIHLGLLSQYNFDSINIKDYGNSNYYLTNDTYENLYKIRTNVDGNYEDINYLDLLKRYHQWYNFYALDFISQINFFHKYINCRVLLVTGGTGVGKSTQVPKLLLYATKMIDHNIKSKILMTQPRVGVTMSNVSRISTELGVPVLQYSKTQNEEINTNNFYVQYQYKNDSHLKNVDNFLKLTTDGTFFNELNRNLTLRRTYNNKYDIIIIDESHEHNTNMDLILTLMKYCLYYNNTIKLVIVSATMSDDEPIYRSFYKDINDNILYPSNYLLQEEKLDRINVDRRIHIAPPGQKNRFNIKEYYENDNKIDTYENNEKLAIEIIKKLCKTTLLGDILVFSVGKEKILKLCVMLNAIIPDDIIALPYYSDLTSRWKNNIQNIANYKFELDMHKEDLIKAINNVTYRKNPTTYNNVIVIATNAAEASLTLPSLYYVVETGFSTVVSYNIISNLIEPKISPISENSRLQRKGRVGRVRDGACYYCYPEFSRQNNRDYYGICIDNIYMQIYNLLYDNINDTLFNDTPDYYKDFIYFGTNNYNKLSILPYKTGFNDKTILDKTGEFYIIHPDELTLKRDYLSRKLIEKPSNKLDKYLELLNKNLMIYTINNNIEKSNIAKYIFSVLNKFHNITYEELITYYYSKLYNTEEEIIIIFSFIYDLNKQMLSFNKYFKKIPRNKSKITDYAIYIDLFNKFKRQFHNLLIFEDTTYIPIMERIDITKYKDLKTKVLNGEIHPFDIPKNSDIDINVFKNYMKKNSVFGIVSDFNKIENNIFKYQSSIYKWCESNQIAYPFFREVLKRYFLYKSSFIKNNKYFDKLNNVLIIKDKTSNKELNFIKTILHKDFMNIGYNNKSISFDGKLKFISTIYPHKYFLYNMRNKMNDIYNIHYITQIDENIISQDIPWVYYDKVTDYSYLLTSIDKQFTKFIENIK